MAQRRGPKAITDEHKAAMATGRAEGRAIKNYLEALEANKPKRGRKRTPESIGARLEKIEAEIDDADPVKRLNLAQERIDLTDELDNLADPIDMTAVEAEFVESAASYGDRKGISYAAWREVGVPAAVLRKAGISRSA